MSVKSDYLGRSFDEILRANKGMGRGFDLLRLALATLILMSHTSGIIGTSGALTAILNRVFHVHSQVEHAVMGAIETGLGTDGLHEQALTGLGRPITLAYLPMFFALSGFLVTGSALRTNRLITFLSLRVLRLLPALLVEVTLSAVILGGLFTTLPLREYFSSDGFFYYFYNVVGDVHMYLPGVFETTSRISAVNANLWTLPWELYCYILMSSIIITSVLNRRLIISCIYVVLTVALLFSSLVYDYQVVPAKLAGPSLVFYFITGMMIYLWRDWVRYKIILFVPAVVFCYVLMMSPRTVFLYPIALTYVTVFIGLSPIPQFKFLKSGDYSYGIYLYGMPVTQALIATFPTLKGNLFLAVLAALTTTLAFAVFSWHGVEKHFLKLKRFISFSSSKITSTLHPNFWTSTKHYENDLSSAIVTGATKPSSGIAEPSILPQKTER